MSFINLIRRNMRVIIPTNRPDKVTTTKYFQGAELFVNNIGVANARHSLVATHADSDLPILMLDDDLVGLWHKENGKYVKEVDLEAMFNYHTGLMSSFSTPFLCIGSNAVGVHNKSEPLLFGRAYSAYYLNCRVLMKNDINFDPSVDLFEDFDMSMQLFDKGFLPLISYEYAMEFKHWNKDGCGTYRTREFMHSSSQNFMNKWRKYGKFLTIVDHDGFQEPRIKFKEMLRYKGIAV